MKKFFILGLLFAGLFVSCKAKEEAAPVEEAPVEEAPVEAPVEEVAPAAVDTTAAPAQQ